MITFKANRKKIDAFFVLQYIHFIHLLSFLRKTGLVIFASLDDDVGFFHWELAFGANQVIAGEEMKLAVDLSLVIKEVGSVKGGLAFLENKESRGKFMKRVGKSRLVDRKK